MKKVTSKQDCKSKEIANKKETKDLYQGLQFGFLTVMQSYKDEKGYLKCICKCKCGEVKEVYMSNLRSKKTRSCGCLAQRNRLNYKTLNKSGGEYPGDGTLSNNNGDLTGRRFGRLTVRTLVGTEKGKSIRWECQCDCGNLVQVLAYNLKNGHTKSCGCLKRVDQLGHVDGTSLTVIGSKKVYKNNTSGVRGVSVYEDRCVAYLTFKGVRYNLGSYKNEEDAIAARLRAEKMYFQSFIEEFESTKKKKK